MMNTAPHDSSTKPLKSRLGLKLSALLIGTFLAVFIGLLFYDMLLLLKDKNKIDETLASPVAAIDPRLETDLAKVLEFKNVQNTADIKNPFTDQSGIGNQSDLKTNTVAPPTISAENKTKNAAAQTNETKNAPVQNVRPPASQLLAVFNPEPEMDTKMRLQLRQEKINLGQDPGPEAMVYAIDDLLPVGVVGGGGGNDEVMFYSESACRVVSFPVNTQFYDGWLDALRPEGVVFGFFDQKRTMRMRGWGRSVSTSCSQNNSTKEQEQTTSGGE